MGSRSAGTGQNGRCWVSWNGRFGLWWDEAGSLARPGPWKAEGARPAVDGLWLPTSWYELCAGARRRLVRTRVEVEGVLSNSLDDAKASRGVGVVAASSIRQARGLEIPRSVEGRTRLVVASHLGMPMPMQSRKAGPILGRKIMCQKQHAGPSQPSH